jgi:hypothetical protein
MLALIVITIISSALLLAAYLKQIWRPILINIGLFLYNFFLAGVAFAAVISVQGALLNILE